MSNGLLNENNSNQFSVKYITSDQKINADTLLYSLYGITTIIQGINREIGTGMPLDIRVKETKTGSFLVTLEILGLIESLKGILTPHNINTTMALISLIVPLIKARLLGAKPSPEPAQSTSSSPNTTTNNNNGLGTFINININIEDRVSDELLKKTDIRQGIDLVGDIIKNASDTSGITLIAGGKTLVGEIRREELLQVPASGVKQELMPYGPPIIIRDTVVSVIRYWTEDEAVKGIFVYEGIEIIATVLDDGAIRVSTPGTRKPTFWPGQPLYVRLEIERELEKEAGIFVNKLYRILKIHNFDVEGFANISLSPSRHLPTRRRPVLSPRESNSDLPDDKNRQASSPDLSPQVNLLHRIQSKYKDLATSSEAFALHKQKEIDLEDTSSVHKEIEQ